MMRIKDLPQEEIKPEHQAVADFFGLSVADVAPEPQPDAYSIIISGNETAQEQYKKCNPYGNMSGRRGAYDFTERLLVVWNGTKVQPA
jgi:hypothetical protein